MANKVNEIEAGARINHPVYRDVYNTTFAKDVITDIEITDDGEITDRCKTEEYGWLPVFYHCKKHLYDESIRTLKANGALTGGVRAFEVGSEVQVLIEAGTPKYVIGHFEQSDPPRMCNDIFKVVFLTSGSIDCEAYFIYSAEEELINGVDYYGDTPICNKEAILLWERDPSYYPYFSDERLVKVGPLCLLFRADGGYDEAGEDMSWVDLWARIDVWTQEREDEYIALGAAMSSEWEAPYSVAPDLPWSEKLWHAMTDIQDYGGRCEGHWDEIKVYGQGEEEA